MTVPNELALDLYHLDLVVVHRRHDARREALLEERKLPREIDRFVHETSRLAAPTQRIKGVRGFHGRKTIPCSPDRRRAVSAVSPGNGMETTG
jgi:hypothetical protein